MGVSVSGVVTLLLLVLIGPFIHVVHRLVRKKARAPPEGEGKTNSTTEDGGAEQREVLKSRDYILQLVGYAIGIGNVWRFPYIIGKYGGASAILVYLLAAVLVSVPLFIMELVIGQYTRKSTIESFAQIRPRWRSLGIAQAIMLLIIICYMQVLISYPVVYLVASCLDPLPWADEVAVGSNATNTSAADDAVLTSSKAEEFWYVEVLGAFTDGESGLGAPQAKITCATLSVYVMTFLAIAFGKEVLAKVTWVTVVGPVLLMGLLVVRCAFLDGAGDGIEYYIGKFDASALSDIDTWAVGTSQVLFSLSPGFGTAVSMSSHTSRTEDVVRVGLIVGFCNSAFSLFGGFAIFSILGNLALKTGESVEEVASRSGTGLAFISIAEAMTMFGDLKNVMSVLFFMMLLTLGLDCQFAMIETWVDHVQDFATARGWTVGRLKLVAIIHVLFFLLSLPFCTRAGNDLLDLVDHYVGSLFLLTVCFLECIMWGVDFGFDRMAEGVLVATSSNRNKESSWEAAGMAAEASQDKPALSDYNGRKLWKWFWVPELHFIVPAGLCFLFVNLIISDVQDPYGGYADGFQATGWTLFIGLVLIAVSMLWKRDPGTLPEKMLEGSEWQKRMTFRLTRIGERASMSTRFPKFGHF